VRVALVVLALSGLLAAPLVWAQARKGPERAPLSPPKVWLAREIAQLTEQQVWLFGADGSSVGVARPEQLRTLLAVFGKLENQAGVNSELYLVEGTDPDTWLAPGKDESSVVIRVTLGLMTMLGSDWDAWAFVFGHQLAHIEFRVRENRAKLLGETPFTLSPFEEEKDADTLGLEWAVRAGYKPNGASLFLSRVAARLSPSALFMRRHPFYPGRLDHVREMGTAPVSR
jgi:hypothetical protein